MKVIFFQHLRLISGMVLMACFSATSYGAQEAEDRELTLAGSAVSVNDDIVDDGIAGIEDGTTFYAMGIGLKF